LTILSGTPTAFNNPGIPKTTLPVFGATLVAIVFAGAVGATPAGVGFGPNISIFAGSGAADVSNAPLLYCARVTIDAAASAPALLGFDLKPAKPS
jgi:hypothetical protein